MFEIAREMLKSWLCSKIVGDSVFRDLLLVAVVGQMVNTSPQLKTSRHISASG